MYSPICLEKTDHGSCPIHIFYACNFKMHNRKNVVYVSIQSEKPSQVKLWRQSQTSAVPVTATRCWLQMSPSKQSGLSNFQSILKGCFDHDFHRHCCITDSFKAALDAVISWLTGVSTWHVQVFICPWWQRAAKLYLQYVPSEKKQLLVMSEILLI